MAPLEDESVILESDGKEFTLTTHRVRIEHKWVWSAYQATILLEDLVSCEIRHRSYPILLILAMVLSYVAFDDANADSRDHLLGGAVLCVMAYLWTRRQVLALSSAAAVIYVHIRGMSYANASKIITAVLTQKNKRYLLLTRQSESFPGA